MQLTQELNYELTNYFQQIFCRNNRTAVVVYVDVN